MADYLHGVIGFDQNPFSYIIKIKERFKQLRKNNLTLSLLNAKIDATGPYFLGHTIWPTGISPNASKVVALKSIAMPKELNDLLEEIRG